MEYVDWSFYFCVDIIEKKKNKEVDGELWLYLILIIFMYLMFKFYVRCLRFL